MSVGDCKKAYGIESPYFKGNEEIDVSKPDCAHCSEAPDFSIPGMREISKASELMGELPNRVSKLWSYGVDLLSRNDGPIVKHIKQPTMTACMATSRRMTTQYFAEHPEVRSRFDINVPKSWRDGALVYLEKNHPKATKKASVAEFESGMRGYLEKGGPVIVKVERLTHQRGEYRHKSIHYLVLEGKPKYNVSTGRYEFNLVDPGTFMPKYARDKLVYSESMGTWVKYPKVGPAKKDKAIFKVLGYLPYQMTPKADRQT